MHLHPDIAALRGNRAPQRLAQEAVAAACRDWHEDAAATAMIADLHRFGAGAPLEACAMLEAVFTGAGEAERLIGLLSQHLCAAIATNRLGHPPFRSGFDGRSASLLLAISGRAQLLLQTREPGLYEHDCYAFSDALRFDAVIGGSAAVRIVRKAQDTGGQGRFFAEPLALERGARLAFDLASETLLVDQVERRLVVLRLLYGNPDPAPGRTYDAASGRFLQQSAGSLATSRQEAIVALLGRMHREDAAPVCVELALGKGDASLRWQAVREGLALDAAIGFAALCRLARRGDDDLAAPAAALRAQLLEAHPELARLET